MRFGWFSKMSGAIRSRAASPRSKAFDWRLGAVAADSEQQCEQSAACLFKR